MRHREQAGDSAEDEITAKSGSDARQLSGGSIASDRRVLGLPPSGRGRCRRGCPKLCSDDSRIGWQKRLSLLRLRELRAQQQFGGGLFFQPHARPTIAGVAGVQKDHTGPVKGALNGVQSRAARIHNPALGIFDRDLG